MSEPRDNVIGIVGPTASGKTALAIELAEQLGGEIVNVDSMQVFRGLDVGTAKPTSAEQARVPFHLIDVIDPGDPFDAAEFAKLADAAIAQIAGRQQLPIAAGGTGLYHRALRYGLVSSPGRDEAIRAELRQWRDDAGNEVVYERLQAVDPVTAQRVHPNDWVRVERALEVYQMTGRPLSEVQAEHGFAEERHRMLLLGCRRPRQELYDRINARMDAMWKEGLLKETRWLLEQDLDRENLPLKALGYRHAADFIEGQQDEDEALRLAKRDTRHFARRQLSWFRRMEDIHWLDVPLDEAQRQSVVTQIRNFLAGSDISPANFP